MRVKLGNKTKIRPDYAARLTKLASGLGVGEMSAVVVVVSFKLSSGVASRVG